MTTSCDSFSSRAARVASAVALVALVVASAGAAQAYQGRQYRDPSAGYPSRMSSDDIRQAGLATGYCDGFERGQYDRSIRAHQPNPQGHGAYQFALDGWNPEWGSAQTYQEYYRQYFIQGYADGYGRRAFNERYRRRF